MGDENTSGGQTLPHDHTSLPEQGGKLSFDGVTESNDLTNGDMTASNAGGVMQRITNANVVGHVLQNDGAGFPVFAAATGGGAVCSDVLVLNTQSRTLCEWLELGA